MDRPPHAKADPVAKQARDDDGDDQVDRDDAEGDRTGGRTRRAARSRRSETERAIWIEDRGRDVEADEDDESRATDDGARPSGSLASRVAPNARRRSGPRQTTAVASSSETMPAPRAANQSTWSNIRRPTAVVSEGSGQPPIRYDLAVDADQPGRKSVRLEPVRPRRPGRSRQSRPHSRRRRRAATTDGPPRSVDGEARPGVDEVMPARCRHPPASAGRWCSRSQPRRNRWQRLRPASRRCLAVFAGQDPPPAVRRPPAVAMSPPRLTSTPPPTAVAMAASAARSAASAFPLEPRSSSTPAGCGRSGAPDQCGWPASPGREQGARPGLPDAAATRAKSSS